MAKKESKIRAIYRKQINILDEMITRRFRLEEDGKMIEGTAIRRVSLAVKMAVSFM